MWRVGGAYINNVLLEDAVGPLLVAGHDIFVALGLEVLAEAELVLDSAEQAWLFLGRLETIVENSNNL
jgi:hypothetical protein